MKVKSCKVFVESKLEAEKSFVDVPSLQNEYLFLQQAKDISPNTPKFFKYVEEGGFSFLFIEHFRSFKNVVGNFSAEELLEVYGQIENTVRKLYEIGIVHTDIHENNIMFRGRTPVLIDFEEARMLSQEVAFEESLDMKGENIWGNVGSMPEGQGLIGGYTCLNRLKEVFKKLILSKLDKLVNECNFDSSCPFLSALDHGKDERIYQSINLSGYSIKGQRPLFDNRIEFIIKLFDKLFKEPFTHLDIGSNLGRFNIEISKNKKVKKSIGIEAYDKYVDLAKILAFLSNSSNVEFIKAECGKDSLLELLGEEKIDVVTLYSVYHHIENKKGFIEDLIGLNPSYLMFEMPVQKECYGGRSWEAEISLISREMDMPYWYFLTESNDYKRPIVLVSRMDVSKKLSKINDISSASPAKNFLSTLRGRPQVSVVLPTYNHLKFVPKAVESVLAQTYDDFELIIVNDGSTDGTHEYLDNLKDPRITVIHQENKHLPEALNAGFRTARGELLTWVSSDNYCAPIFLEAFVAALDAHPDAGFAYSAHAWMDENGQITGVCKDQDVSYHRLLASGVGVTSFMYRRLCQEKIGLYDPTLEGAEDWDMWLRILEQFRPVYVPDVLSYYRRHRDSMTENVKEKIFRASRQTFQKAVKRRNNQFDMAELYPTIELCRDIETAKFYAYFDLGTTLLQSQFTQVELASQALEKALLMSPDSFQTAGNLAVAYGRLGRWEKVVPLLRQITQKSENPKALEICRSIVEAHRTNKPGLLAKISLFVPDKESVELFQLEKEHKLVFSFTDTGQRTNLYVKQRKTSANKRPESGSARIELKKEVRENFKIGMAVLACNRPEYLEICLDTLFQTKLYNYDITFLLQDDGSTDPRVRDIIEKPRDPKYKIVRFYAPKGHNSWGAAFNKAMTKLLEIDDFDIIGSCDSDALFHPEWLDKTMKICLWAKKNHTDHILGPFSSFNSSDYKFHKILGTYQSPYGGYVVKERMGAVNYFYFQEDFVKLGFFEEHRDDETLMTEKFRSLKIRNFSTETSYVEHIGEVSVLNQWRPGFGAFGAHAMKMAKSGWPAELGRVGTMGYFKYIHKNASLEPARSSNTKIDILIPVVEKDLDILPLVIDGARENLRHPIGRIFVVAPQSHEIKSLCLAKGCEFVSEDSVLPIIKKNITHIVDGVDRSGWLFQQLIKLAGDSICSQEHYLALDADTVLVRPQVFEVNGKIVLLHSDEHHHPYFELYKRLFGVEAKTMFSFVSHHMLFKSSLVSEFKKHLEECHHINWIETLFRNIDSSLLSSMSEYELYGQWMFANHPDKITREYWFNISLKRQMYTPELEARLKRCCRSISFHHYNADTLVETPFIQSAPVPTASQHRNMLTEGLERKKPVLVGSRVLIPRGQGENIKISK